MPNHKISIPGYDYDATQSGNRWIKKNIESEINPDDQISGFAKPITIRAFNYMRKRFLNRLEDIFAVYTGSALDKETVQVTFGKEAILILLSQQNCAGITFCFGMNDIPNEQGIVEERVTLMACGAMPVATEDGFENIGKPRFDANDAPQDADPPVYEVVPGSTYGIVIGKMIGESYSNFL